MICEICGDIASIKYFISITYNEFIYLCEICRYNSGEIPDHIP